MRNHRKQPTNRSGSAASHRALRPFSILNSQLSIPRRGTVLVFVLGILTLLALVGLVLIARTHGEFQRVTLDGNAANTRGVLDGLVGSIQDTLRQDIWGQTSNQLYPLQPRPTADDGDIRENNEAYDAPGIDDRWLASLTPYNAGTAPPTGDLMLIPPPIGNPMSLVGEYNVLAWPNVSYIGVDLLAPAGQKPGAPSSTIPNLGVRPFVWASNSRVPSPLPAVPVWYKTEKLPNKPTDNLQNVCVLQTPPVPFSDPILFPNLIPGSTTNVTIAQSRDTWLSTAHQTALTALPEFGVGSSRVPQFPYFDTNADGILDLYDADGDGIPDSPLSLRIPVTSGDANAPHDLYAAVRIVDHNAMLNVNTASSLRRPTGGATDLTFDEFRAGLQRRGQRSTELLLDEVVHSDDRDYSTAFDRAKGLVGSRYVDVPDIFDREWIRTKLIGGRHTGINAAFLYGLADESALRHRGTLVPYDRRFESQPGNATDYTNIDRALRGTLQWGRGINGGVTYDVGNGVPAHWNRFNSNFGSLDYEGSDLPPTGSVRGWRSMMTEDEPYAIRRHMLTTASHDVMPMPDLIKNVTAVVGETLLDTRLKQLWSLGMDWPVLIASDSPLIGLAPPYWSANSFSQKFVIAPAQMPPEHFRAQPIDLNMGDIDQPAAKEAFIRYAAAAMYMALEDVPFTTGAALPFDPLDPEPRQYQGIKISGPSFRNQEYLAWQFAVNLADYRDADNEPTAWEWPVGLNPPHYVFGIEKQPFFTEAYAFFKAGVPPGPAPSSGSGPDKWWFAVELFVPPFWMLDAGDLTLRIPRPVGPPTILPLASAFKHRTFGTFPAVLDGGTTGQYYVFCGINANAPMWATGNPVSYPLGSGYNDFYQIVPAPGVTDLQLPTDGAGRIELWYSNPSVPQHVIDIIGPQFSGDRLEADPSSPASGPASGMGLWAARPPGAMVPDTFEFSLIRCTLGWRFTTAWQHFEWEREVLIPSPTSGRPVPKSLGRSNEPFPNNPLINRTKYLYQNIPESIWPARASIDLSGPAGVLDLAATPLNGFAPSQAASNRYSPYPAFDSPADLSKIMLVGPLTQQGINPPTFKQDSAVVLDPLLADFPATASLASMIQYGSNTSPILASPADQPPASDLAARMATGRVNFAPVDPNQPSKPQPTWVGRLFNFFTTQSPLFDGIDNDGNLITDLSQLGINAVDPLEAWAVTHRAAGRLNVNTAPAHVLRSVPYMSLLPTSPEFLFHVVMGGGINPLPNNYNPYATYFGQPAPKPFWDFASVIVARRENRNVPLRMWDPSYTPNLAIGETNMRTVAIAGPPPVAPGPAPVSGPSNNLKGPFRSLSDLQRLYDRTDLSVTADPYLFRVDRFISDPTLRLPQHRYQTNEPMPGVGAASPLSPDFRFRRTSATTGILDYAAIPSTAPLAAPAAETGGLRARDALLSRWANGLTVRSDVFTAYIALIDENGNYVRRSQVTFDRSGCFRETAPGPNATRTQIQPEILNRTDTNYSDDTK
ncbi:MAG: hypothetical protein AABZ08_11930 [Planctomycetota bacterium]